MEEPEVALTTWYNEHISHPFPTKKEKKILACGLKITIKQVENFFFETRKQHKTKLYDIANFSSSYSYPSENTSREKMSINYLTHK